MSHPLTTFIPSTTSLRHTFVAHLPHLTQQFPLPDSLRPHHHTVQTLSAAPTPNGQSPNSSSPTTELTSWWLAERILLHVLEDETFEQEVIELVRCVRQALAADSWMTHAFDVVEQVVDVMTYAFQNVTLKNAFDQDNALPTVYYMLLFVVCCACGEEGAGAGETGSGDGGDDVDGPVSPRFIEHVRVYEPAMARIAVVVHKLLLNQEVFEFVRNCGYGGRVCGGGLCGGDGRGGSSSSGSTSKRRWGRWPFGGCMPNH